MHISIPDIHIRVGIRRPSPYLTANIWVGYSFFICDYLLARDPSPLASRLEVILSAYASPRIVKG